MTNLVNVDLLEWQSNLFIELTENCKMRKTIFEELRKRNLQKNGVWKFNEYNVFRNTLNPLQKEKFDREMLQLVQEGILSQEKDGLVCMYRLTESGEKEIYKQI